MQTGALSFMAEPSLWRRLAACEKPIVLYGMGDGADKLIARLNSLARQPDGIFASDEFVRGQLFHNLPVITMAAAERQFGGMCVLVCFGTEQPEVLARIYALAERQEVYAPHLPLFGDALFDEAFAAAHKEELLAVDGLWADEESRAVYRGYLAYMWSGRVDILRRIESPRPAAWRLLNIGGGAVYWDLGAYDGDTAAEFARLTAGDYREILAWEPDEKNYRKLCAALDKLPNARALPYAAWHSTEEVYFSGRAGRNSAVAGADAPKARPVQAAAMDDLLTRCFLPPDFIKLDVEGAEEAALSGAAGLLREYRPKLALAAYHRTEDIIRLPLLLKKLNPAYRLYLRHHPYIPGWETNIYAC